MRNILTVEFKLINIAVRIIWFTIIVLTEMYSNI